MYAVVAPGLKGVYRDSKSLNEVLSLYPYARFTKLPTEEQCLQWIRANTSTRKLEEVRDYGDALALRHIIMDYYLTEHFIFINYGTKNFGNMRISVEDDSEVEELIQTPTFCSVKIRFEMQAKPIQRHLLALQRGLRLVGDMVDIVVRVPDHSIFYALRSYTGQDPIVRRVQAYVNERRGGTSISLRKD